MLHSPPTGQRVDAEQSIVPRRKPLSTERQEVEPCGFPRQDSRQGSWPQQTILTGLNYQRELVACPAWHRGGKHPHEASDLERAVQSFSLLFTASFLSFGVDTERGAGVKKKRTPSSFLHSGRVVD